ncbi:hypothetical protein ACHAXR_006813 [Thalassiosira sp. AJA248-18]
MKYQPLSLTLTVASSLLLWAGQLTPTALAFSAQLKTKTKNPPRSLLHKLDRFLTKLQNPEEQLADHTYLSGNYAPVSQEHVQVPVEIVEGELPSSLSGMFVRNGPNPVMELANPKRYHWFDGHGMIHCLAIENGQARYTNQFVPSTRYQVEQELGETFFPNLGEYSGVLGLLKIIFHPEMVKQKVSDLKTVLSPNTNCIMYRNKFYCLNEGNLMFECKLLPTGQLEHVGYETFQGVLDFPVSAHPRIDHNGDLLFHSYTTNNEDIQAQGTMKVGRYSAETQMVESYFVPTDPDQSYISFAHNLLFTEHYTIIWDCSVHFDTKAMFDGGSYFRTNRNYNLRFGIIPKAATSREEVVWIDTGKPGGIVHPLNAWEEDDGTIVLWTPLCDHLVVDLDTDEINKFNMVEYKFKLDPDLKSGKVISEEVIDAQMNIEFSAVPDMGMFTRFGYTAIQDPNTPGEGSFSGFCIWDMVERKIHKAVYYNDNEVGGEPMLVNDDNNQTYVGTYIYNLKEEQTYFLLYDGTTAELVTRLKMPHRVPFGFHGLWVSGEELEGHFEHHGVTGTMLKGTLPIL